MRKPLHRQPINLIGGFLFAAPVALVEWYYLVADGGWWLPHPASGPLPAAAVAGSRPQKA
jgi:hypothetical protein